METVDDEGGIAYSSECMHAFHSGERVYERCNNAFRFFLCLMSVHHANRNQAIIYTVCVLCFKILCWLIFVIFINHCS